MIHPKQINSTSFSDLSFTEILTGYSNGWDAYAKLYDGLGHPHDLNSWNTMCEAYNLPTNMENLG